MANEEPTRLIPIDQRDTKSLADDVTRLASSTPADTNYQPDFSISPNQSRTQLQIGDMLKNRFEVVDKLGEGGMGMVFKAKDLRKVETKSHNPYIAIKVLHPDLAQNETLVTGLQRECEKAQHLSHPNIITVFDFDRDGDFVFMSMELLSGQSLKQIIRETATTGGISFQRAWPIILQMGNALAYAHRKGIVHSDFKPGNVVVTDQNEVKVLDFGIAARTGLGTDPDATVFNARAEGGLTLPYASFEMINGAKADPRDDVYAFGLVVYEMLTGKHPYNRQPASIVFIEQQSEPNKYALAPPKGLSRRQWQSLKSTIELLQDKRPKNLDAWLDEFAAQSRVSPIKWLAGIIVTLSLATGAFLVKDWLGKQREQTEFQEELNPIEEQPPTSDPTVTPPVTYALPVALAGKDQQAQVGETVQLDGTASQSGDGQELSYIWNLLEVPTGSVTRLQQANSITPKLTPDVAGEYVIELTVRDGHNSSTPALTRLTVAEPPKPTLSHQASSGDGLLSLAAGKPQYRIGEKLRLNLHVSKAGYLRVAYIGANGEVAEILPNQNQKSKVKADSTLQIPPRGAKFDLEITGPAGKDKIVAVYSQSPISNLEKIVNKEGDIASEYLQDSSLAVIQYAVVKK